MWIQHYIESAQFTDAQVDNTGDMTHNDWQINLRYANQIFRGYDPHDHHDLENMMLDKYRLLGLPEELWKNLDVNFDLEKSNKLHVITTVHKKYMLVNNNSQAGTINAKPYPHPYYRVFMHEITGFSLIDWWKTIYEATENHHVSTSTFFLMQAIKNKYPDWNAPCYIYPRPNENGLRGISQLNPTFNLIRVCQ